MQQLSDWTLETIRRDDAMMSWIEERRHEWVPVVGSAIAKILEGQSMLVITDDERRWFGRYIVASMNQPGSNRPLLPIFSFDSLYSYTHTIRKDEDVQLLYDMLGLAFPNGFFFFYIGRADHPKTRFALRNEESMLWVMDDELSSSFALRSHDDLIDIKLLQLYRLFAKTVDAALFSDVELNV